MLLPWTRLNHPGAKSYTKLNCIIIIRLDTLLNWIFWLCFQIQQHGDAHVGQALRDPDLDLLVFSWLLTPRVAGDARRRRGQLLLVHARQLTSADFHPVDRLRPVHPHHSHLLLLHLRRGEVIQNSLVVLHQDTSTQQREMFSTSAGSLWRSKLARKQDTRQSWLRDTIICTTLRDWFSLSRCIMQRE